MRIAVIPALSRALVEPRVGEDIESGTPVVDKVGLVVAQIHRLHFESLVIAKEL